MVEGLGFRVWGSGFGVQGWGLGFRLQVSGLRVYDFRFSVRLRNTLLIVLEKRNITGNCNTAAIAIAYETLNLKPSSLKV